jgi:hypothetical protein
MSSITRVVLEAERIGENEQLVAPGSSSEQPVAPGSSPEQAVASFSPMPISKNPDDY